MDERKDVADLSDTERDNFVNALLDFKNKIPSQTQVPSELSALFPQPQNRYDDYVMMHMMSFSVDKSLSMIAHRSPTFLPWHRSYLRYLERELQRIKPEYKDVTIPYWDWTSERSSNALWDKEFMGGDGRETDWRVMDGRFAYDTGKWNLYIAPGVNSAYRRPDLCRKFRYYQVDELVSPPTKLPNADNVTDALKINPYDGPNWDNTVQPSFRNRLEGGYGEGRIHNIVHVWVGGMIIKNEEIIKCGAMAYGGSPNDPVFWLHHSNIDRLWADWQLDPNHWNQNHKGYEPQSGGPVNFNANDPMLPWYPTVSITPAMVSNFYKIDSKGYKYDKYFRKTTRDQTEEMMGLKTEDETTTHLITDDILGVNFDYLKDSADTLIQTLKKPLFPFNDEDR